MSNDEAESDFEKACAIRWGESHSPKSWPRWAHISEPLRASERRGMLAALRQMREPSEKALDAARYAQHWSNNFGPDISREQDQRKWQAMLDELIRQGEREAAPTDG